MMHAGKNNPAFERVHLALVTVAIPREHDDQRDLGKFGRLEACSCREPIQR